MSEHDELAALTQRVDAVDRKVGHIEAVNAMNTAQVLTSLDSFRTAVHAQLTELRTDVKELKTGQAQIIEMLSQLIGKDASK
jgi:hypothetical protein